LQDGDAASGYTRGVSTARKPLQFSLGSLFCLIVGLGSVLAGCLPYGKHAPLIGWVLLTVIYYRQGWRDLIFLHSLAPGISVSLLAMLVGAAVFNPSFAPWEVVRDGLSHMAFWLLFVGCLGGNIASQIYYVYLLLVVRPERNEGPDGPT
jgi:hypothetical protein